MALVGQAVPRIDGMAKVTGRAVYTADVRLPGLAYAVIVGSRVAKGAIAAVDDQAARALPGVLAVITAANFSKLTPPDPLPDSAGQHRLPLQDEMIDHLGQAVAVVVGETRQAAEEAAMLLEVTYASVQPVVQDGAHLQTTDVLTADHDFAWAAAAAAPAAAGVTVEAIYRTPYEHHNPIEPAATTCSWSGDNLLLHDATQWLRGVQTMVRACLGLAEGQVRVVSQFVGGSFGAKRLTWPHVLIAAVAARIVGRPVTLTLSRRQMFTMLGHRPRTEQRVKLTADSEGHLVALEHESLTTTSANDDFVEPATAKTRMIYACPQGKVSRKLAKLDLPTPTTMRAPGEATGFFALESAMDELAATLKLDPLAVRLLNYAEKDPVTQQPWSSKSLKACYETAATRFGWSARQTAPRSMRDADGLLVGWGMASAAYPVNRSPASARVAIGDDGRLVVQSGTHDMGAGTYTALAQIAGEEVGVGIGEISVELGDTRLPRTTVSGGSRTLASVGSAVFAAARALRQKLIETAVGQPGPLQGVDPAAVGLGQGRAFLLNQPERGVTLAQVVGASGSHQIDAQANAVPNPGTPPPMLSFGAHFVEVKIDPDLPIPRVTRVVSAFAAGHVVNPLIGRNQLAGGIVGGIGMALLEESTVEPGVGGFLNTSLGNYLVPVSADVPAIEVILVDEEDRSANPLGTKGIGELGIVGAAAAVANAVFHATAVRCRRLPIRVDDLLAG